MCSKFYHKLLFSYVLIYFFFFKENYAAELQVNWSKYVLVHNSKYWVVLMGLLQACSPWLQEIYFEIDIFHILFSLKNTSL